MAKKKVTKKNKKQTFIAIVLDRSGSMSTIWKQALDGLNETLNDLRLSGDKGGDTVVSVIAFDGAVDLLVEGAPADVIPDFTNEELFPRGSTALCDAIKVAVESIGNVKETDDTGFLVTVISDGEENASRTISRGETSKLIKDLEATGKWTFNFMLANQDIHKFADLMNIPLGNVAAFAATSDGMTKGFDNLRSANARYLAARSTGQTFMVDTYSPDINS